MDTSETNIKMCEKAKEIQIEHWRRGWLEGDYFSDGKKVCICGMDYLQITNYFRDGQNYARFVMREPLTALTFKQFSPMDKITIKEGKYEIISLYNGIWLPRQDQLQEMVGGWALELLDKFYTFCMWDEQYEELRDKMHPISIEQLWLAFVMKEKYHKVWDGKEWKKTTG